MVQPLVACKYTDRVGRNWKVQAAEQLASIYPTIPMFCYYLLLWVLVQHTVGASQARDTDTISCACLLLCDQQLTAFSSTSKRSSDYMQMVVLGPRGPVKESPHFQRTIHFLLSRVPDEGTTGGAERGLGSRESRRYKEFKQPVRHGEDLFLNPRTLESFVRDRCVWCLVWLYEILCSSQHKV